jgi:integrase
VPDLAGRRGWGEDSIYFDHSGECRDPDNHRHYAGRWRGVVSLKSGPEGKRRRKKVSGRNKTEVRAKLAELHDELNDGVVTDAGYTVAQAIRDHLADGLPGRAPKTIRTQREVLEPLLPILANVPLRELTAADVRSALIMLAATRATRTVSMTHAALARAIKYAEASDKVRRNVAALIDSPSGRQGRPSRSLTFEQAVAMITAAQEYALCAYVVLSLLVGLRTEEARALRWDHVHLGADSPLPPHVDVWRSVRAHGGVKISKSRRSLALPAMAVAALTEHQERQARARLRAGELWQEQGLVFTTALGTRLYAGNVRRSLRAICRNAGIGENWTPRELRHTFVSLLSDNGMAIEEISRLVGHSSTWVSQTVYRHELRPLVTSGVELMDRIFADGAK